VKYWESVADNVSKAGWSWGCVSGVNSRGRTFFVADAHRGGGKRFIVRADDKVRRRRRTPRCVRHHYAISKKACGSGVVKVWQDKTAERRWHTGFDRRSLV